MSESLSIIFTLLNLLGLSGMTFYTNKRISKIIEKSPDILFGHYSKMKIYLLELKVTLGNEMDTPLFATLSKDYLENNNIITSTESLTKLEELVGQIINFFKTEEWQIPLDLEFEQNLTELLKEIMYLEKGNLCCYSSNKEEVRDNLFLLNKLIDDLIEKINLVQKNILLDAKRKTKGIKSNKFDKQLKLL